MNDRITEEVVANALSKKYPTPQYSFLTHVRNQTGYGSHESIRTADAIALGLWSSRGQFLEGFEIKVSRTDWIKELKDPSKAESIAKYCHYWWLVVSDENIIQPGELPIKWGLKVLIKGHIVTIKQAELNQERTPMSMDFLCGFMRNVSENIGKIYMPIVEVEKTIEERVEARIQSRIHDVNRNAEEYSKLIERIKEFEEIIGIDFHDLRSHWGDPKKFGVAVKTVLNGDHVYIRKEMERLVESANKISERATEELKNLPILEEIKK